MKRLFLIVMMVALPVIFMAAGCGDDRRDRVADDGTPSDSLAPDQVTSRARMYLYSAGRKTTDLTADQLQQFSLRDSTVATNLKVDFFDSTGARMSTLTADEGYIREKDNFLAVSGSVVVVGRDSVTVLTEYLEWNGAKDSVVTDSFVTVIQHNDTLYSYGMQTDPKMKNITFKRKVSGRLTDVEKIRDEDY